MLHLCVYLCVCCVFRWSVECLHIRRSWQQSRDGPGTQPLTFVQSEPFVTSGLSQSDRRA